MTARPSRIRSLRSRLLAIALLAIIALAAMGMVIWRLAVEPALSAGVSRAQQEIAGRAADQIEAFINRQIGELVAAADFGLFWEDRRGRQREILRQLMKLNSAISEVAVADQHGREILRVSRSRLYTDADLGSLVGHPSFEAAMLGETHLGRVYHASTAEPLVTVSVPIKFNPREIGGVLVAEINLKALWDPIADISVGQAGSVYVVDREGRLLAHRDYSKVLLRTVLARHPDVRRAAVAQGHRTMPARVVPGLDSGPSLSTIAFVLGTQWAVIAEEPVETALSSVRQVERLALGLMLVALVAGGIFAVWFSGRITRPLRQLEDGAARIARGELGHRLEISTNDEIQRLADRFNHMASELQASRGDLERRVAVATRDLSALYALVTPLGRASDLREVLRDALAKIVEFTDADGGLVRLLETEVADVAALPADDDWEGAGFTPRWRQAIEELLDREAVAEGPVVLDSAGLALGRHCRSAVFLPLASNNRKFGAMVLVSARPAAFTGSQLELFRAISRQVVLALENAQLYQQERQTSEFLRSIAKSVDPIFTTDTHGVVTYASPRALEVFGYAPSEILGQRVYDRCRGGADEARLLMERLRVDGHVQDYETSLQRAAGGWVETSFSLSLLRDAGDHVVGTVAVVRDITEEKRLREELRQAQKMEAIGRLAGGVAHDFNNLLTVIIGRTQMLLSAQAAPPKSLELIRSTAQRAASLTRQLLAFSRRQMLKRHVQDLNATVSAIAPMLRRLIGEDIDLRINLGPGALWVNADTSQLEQVLLNLAVNARDAMPQGGRLEIETAHSRMGLPDGAVDRAAPPGSDVVLAVSDTGVGMDAETLSHVFEPFFTTKGPGKGTGLGLATVHGIVHQHEGHITVDSTPGRGATFRVYLPQVAAPAASEAPREDPHDSPQGSETVLLVEDEESVRELLAETLQTAGYLVLEASTPEAALDLANTHHRPIDLLLTDVVMPQMSGRQLAERLVAEHRKTRVLYMSGYTGDALDRSGVAEHGEMLLQKPFTPDVLLTRLRRALDAPLSASPDRGPFARIM